MFTTKFKSIITVFATLAVALALPATTLAAEFHSGESVAFSKTDTLKDAYVFGSTVSISAPVTNDLVVAGGTVTINSDIADGLLAAGGTVTLDGTVGQSARIAGGTIVVNSQINRDLVIFGGTVTVSSTATILGDLVITGGNVTIDGPVTGKVIINGGQVKINSHIGELANSHVDQLTLGSKAVVDGNLSYQAPQEAQMDKGASVKGKVDFQKAATGQQQNRLFASGAFSSFGFFYAIMASLVFCFALLYVANKITSQAVTDLKSKPWLTVGWGLGAIFLFPILSFMVGLLSIWLGIAGFLLYILCLMIAYGLAEILLGWWLLQWWFGRNKETYQLDWRAVIVGVAAATLLMLVPIIGWFIMAAMVLLAMGTLGQQIWNLRASS